MDRESDGEDKEENAEKGEDQRKDVCLLDRLALAYVHLISSLLH